MVLFSLPFYRLIFELNKCLNMFMLISVALLLYWGWEICSPTEKVTTNKQIPRDWSPGGEGGMVIIGID